MNRNQTTPAGTDLFSGERYRIDDLSDDISADRNCQELLTVFHKSLVEEMRIEPLEAGAHARGADYFLRDYMIDHRRDSIFSISAEKIRGFAGNWYIVSTLEPNMAELRSLLEGVRHFYRFCRRHNAVDDNALDDIDRACSDLAYYQERIDAFHTLGEDEYLSWNAHCPVN